MDGLRGIAIVLVMALHVFKRANDFSKHPTLHHLSSYSTIGWIGVDLFFVLSGFLITSILLNTREKPDYFKNFYIRRTLRIVPLYYLVLLIVLLLIIPIKQPDFVGKISSLIPIQLLYLQNWRSILIHFDTTAYILLTWSLAIEEQFYLFWPFMVYFLKRESLIKFSIGYFLLSTIIRVIGILVWNDMEQATHFFYYNSFSRFDELIFGGLLAMGLSNEIWRERIKRLAFPSLFISVVVFAVLCFAGLPNLPHPDYRHVPLNIAGYTSLSVFTAALIAIFITHPENSIIRRFFRNGVLGFLGKYSYAMYLFHMPIALILLDALWAIRYHGWKMFLFYIFLTYFLTILLAVISWHVFEKHFLGLKKYFEYK